MAKSGDGIKRKWTTSVERPKKTWNENNSNLSDMSDRATTSVETLTGLLETKITAEIDSILRLVELAIELIGEMIVRTTSKAKTQVATIDAEITN